MKILMITNDFWPMVGGVANHVWNLSESLSSLNCEVTVVHICYGSEYLGDVRKTNFEIKRFAVASGLNGKQSLFAKLARYFVSATVAVRCTNSLINSLKPDIVHWHDIYHSSITTKLLTENSATFVCTNHASNFLEQFEKGAVYHYLLKLLLKHAQGVIAPSEELSFKSSKFNENVKFIPNGVDVNFFVPSSSYRKDICQKLNIDENDFLIVSPRRMDRKNGLEVLILSIPLLVQHHKNIKVVIAGGGNEELKNEYLRLCEQLHVENYFRFIGNKTQKEMSEILPSADLVVIPSHREAVSLSALEALSCGVPVVASNTGGLPYLINDSNGALFETGSHEDLALKLKFHLDNQNALQEKGEKGRRDVMEQLTWNKIALQTIEFYRSTISQANI